MTNPRRTHIGTEISGQPQLRQMISRGNGSLSLPAAQPPSARRSAGVRSGSRRSVSGGYSSHMRHADASESIVRVATVALVDKRAVTGGVRSLGAFVSVGPLEPPERGTRDIGSHWNVGVDSRHPEVTDVPSTVARQIRIGAGAGSARWVVLAIVAIGSEGTPTAPPPRSAAVSLAPCTRSPHVSWAPSRDRRTGGNPQVSFAPKSFLAASARRR